MLPHKPEKVSTNPRYLDRAFPPHLHLLSTQVCPLAHTFEAAEAMNWSPRPPRIGFRDASAEAVPRRHRVHSFNQNPSIGESFLDTRLSLNMADPLFSAAVR